jgi:putative DNA primase/helicase
MVAKGEAHRKAGNRPIKEVEADIVARTNVEDFYKNTLGFVIKGSRPNDKGWLSVLGKDSSGADEKKASAAINVGGDPKTRGRYKNQATGESYSIFEAGVRFGRFSHWTETRQHLADKLGMNVQLPSANGKGKGKRRKPKSGGDTPHPEANGKGGSVRASSVGAAADGRPPPTPPPSVAAGDGGSPDWCQSKLDWCRHASFTRQAAIDLAKSKPPVGREAVDMAGGRAAMWPKKAPLRQLVLAFPAYDADGKVSRYCLIQPNGRQLSKYEGPNHAPSTGKVFTVGPRPGFLNRFALDRLAAAEIVWKVEGVTDLLALQTAIPEGLQETHLVITNSGGCSESPDGYVSRLAGKVVHVVGDCDTPGQKGAARWCNALAGKAAEVRNVVLPFEVETKHGKDLRDYFNDGMTYAELLQLAAAAAPTPASGGTGNMGGERGTGATSGAAPLGSADPDIDAALRRTDMGNAHRLVEEFGGVLRYVHKWKKWLWWDGRRWAEDDGAHIGRLARETLKKMAGEAIDSDEEGLLKHVCKSAQASHVEGMVKLARSEEGVPIEPEKLDTDNWLLNCPNGTLDLRTMELRPLRQEDYVTKLCPVEYKPEAKCPKWEAFVSDILRKNTDMVSYVQKLLGRCVSGDITEHVLAIFYGVGRNGRSTLLNAVERVLGPDYAMTADAELLLTKKSSGHPTGKMDLQGKRFVSASETNPGERLAEALIKQLTGGDRIRGRKLYRDNSEFDPTHKIFLSTNAKPTIRGTDVGIWERIALVPFQVVYWDADKAENADREPDTLMQNKRLPEELAAEREGILAWLVRGFLAWRSEGLRQPEIVADETRAYRSEEDVIGQWVEECCDVTKPSAKTLHRILYACYTEWMRQQGDDDVVSPKAFGSILEQKGYEKARAGGGPKARSGIRLTAEAEKNFLGIHNDDKEGFEDT